MCVCLWFCFIYVPSYFISLIYIVEDEDIEREEFEWFDLIAAIAAAATIAAAAAQLCVESR